MAVLVADAQSPPGHQLLVVPVPPDRQVEVVLGLHAALEHRRLPLRHEHLSVLNVGHEPRRHRFLLLRHGGSELALLDGVEPAELLHADLEVSGPFNLG